MASQVVSSSPRGSLSGSIYWIGADGNVYLKGAGGNGASVKNLGNPQQAQTWNLGLNGAVQVGDPNPGGGGGGGQQAAQTAPSGGGGGGGGYSAPAPKPDRSNSIALQMAGLGAVDQQYNSGVSAIDSSLGKLMGQYGEEAAANEKIYTDSSNSNQNNLQKNKQTAMVNAAQGRQGLFGTLASIGALNGSGIDLANRSVQKGANDDLSGAADSYAGNQTNLDTAVGTFRRENKNRKENAETAAANAKTNAQNEAAKSRMGYYSQLVNDYSAMGNEGEAKKYTGMASALYPQLATTSIPNSNIAYSGAAFSPGSLSKYLAGADSTVVSTTPTAPGQTIPGLIASPTTKKKQLQSV